MRLRTDFRFQISDFRLRRWAVALLWLALFVVAWAAQEESMAATPTPMPPKDCVLRGRVVSAVTKQPVARAEVEVRGEGDAGYFRAKLLTDASGEFTVTNLAPGAYTVSASRAGAVSSSERLFQQSIVEDEAPHSAPNRGDGQRVRVVSANQPPVVITLEPGGTIRGRVAFSDGEPAVGVAVFAVRQAAKGVLLPLREAVSVTDDKGRYALSGLAEGEYMVGAIAIVGTFRARIEPEVLAFYPAAHVVEEAETVKVAGGGETGEINLRVETARRRLAGTVRVRGSQQLFAVKVTAQRLPDKKATDNSPTDDAASFRTSYRLKSSGVREDELRDELLAKTVEATRDGKWSFSGLPPGKYSLRVAAQVVPPGVELPTEDVSELSYDDPARQRYYELAEEASRQSKQALKTKEVSLTDGDVTDVEIELNEGITLSGTVRAATGGPLGAPVTVTAWRYWEPREKPYYVTLQAETDAAGNFTIEGLHPGRYWIGAAFGQPYGNRFYLRDAFIGDVDLTKQPLDVRPDAPLTGVQMVVATDAATLRGRVRLEGLQTSFYRVCQTRVQAQPDWFCYNTDYTGAFSYNLPPGDYLIFALPFSPGNARSFNELLERLAPAGQRLTLLPGQTHEVELTPPQP
jgi:hypothetical protein